ncbi:MAG: hypothetical protein IM576_11960, partial [Pseudanabaena sp. M074S1SP2A07QC]|nr:hypothetical protein [Pseudanabaena sp. M074S1SP2A07QC]
RTCFSKEFVRSRQPRTRQELAQAITDAFNIVSKKDLLGWFSHCDAMTVLI